ncbi:putative Luciferin 4-monooxygenase, partial [Daphnia magna]
PRRDGRDLDARRGPDARLFPRPRDHRASHEARWLVRQWRPGPTGCRRCAAGGRTPQGNDHPLGLQRVPRRGRGGVPGLARCAKSGGGRPQDGRWQRGHPGLHRSQA